ncbi:S-adenosyl-L-methionine-dependent methyltransferase [Xylariales sp. PMI_506]|nr:S-adenosyl-L-methionine-dependent methyltransferase [Xylariales sp. PMI_506]
MYTRDTNRIHGAIDYVDAYLETPDHDHNEEVSNQPTPSTSDFGHLSLGWFDPIADYSVYTSESELAWSAIPQVFHDYSLGSPVDLNATGSKRLYSSTYPFIGQPPFPEVYQAGVNLPMANPELNTIPGTYAPESQFIAPQSSELPDSPIDPRPGAPAHIPTGDSVIDSQSVVGDFGRTYHGYKEGKYLLPNDAAEQDRLDFQYTAISILMGGKLFFAPLTNPKHALDVATGTGIWAVEFAERFPDCDIIGTDLSAIQPGNAPPNVTFLKDDAEGEWLFPNKFDYIHLRLVFTCFNDPKKMMQEAFNSMNSGGWLEYQDGEPQYFRDGGDDGDLAFQRMAQAGVRGAKLLAGRDIEVACKYKTWMEEVGFINVRELKLRLPVSPWSADPREKLVGSYMQRNYLDGSLLAIWKMLKAGGSSEEEAERVIEDSKRELMDMNKRIYSFIYVVYGQKP